LLFHCGLERYTCKGDDSNFDYSRGWERERNSNELNPTEGDLVEMAPAYCKGKVGYLSNKVTRTYLRVWADLLSDR
jgi:hypothetical protein